MEHAPAAELFKQPFHPYTQGLLNSLASVHKKVEKLPAIAGNPPNRCDSYHCSNGWHCDNAPGGTGVGLECIREY